MITEEIERRVLEAPTHEALMRALSDVLGNSPGTMGDWRISFYHVPPGNRYRPYRTRCMGCKKMIETTDIWAIIYKIDGWRWGKSQAFHVFGCLHDKLQQIRDSLMLSTQKVNALDEILQRKAAGNDNTN